ncbi:MAG: DEAD/DEAH box helicase [Acetobacteraceae bacterium]|nr:DEAD/DEAH box helicase [Acetobacteraceae bacterium]
MATILEADALSLETTGDGDAMQLVPVLHRAGDGAKPLLFAGQQHAFGAGQFHQWPTARSVYTLPGGVYVAVSPPLRQALDVARHAAAGTPAQRRAFLREPRAAIRAAIGDEADAAVLDSLVIETPAWSERVIGLGLWEPRVLPWIALPPNEWFGPAQGEARPRSPQPLGLQVGDRCIRLTPESASDLARRVETAIATGQPRVIEQTPEGPVEVPATQATLQALAALTPEHSPEPTTAPEVLIIKPNENGRDIEALVQRRPAPPIAEPANLKSKLKAHQSEGLLWLQQNWMAGSPGVLLADDMGLGKTLQGLAFLRWLRNGMEAGQIPRAPLLVVAPTGLLENWRAEHELHLRSPGLGTPLLAYGKGLAALRMPANGGATLDQDALRGADWVLTTYETLRDHDRDFGGVRFAAMLLDEAQKFKTPGIRLTDAVKAMNADFRVALTGTPVENRLADLWCIVDGVAAGHLGDLRRFSATYEGNSDPQMLMQLKASLDRPLGGRPALLLRRLREDRLPDLPPQESKLLRAEMMGAQLAAYNEAVAIGRGDQGLGRVLEALQRLRSVSLHPDPNEPQDDDALITGSARFQVAIAALDEIAQSGEAALVFLDDLTLMARLTGVLQRRYALADAPMTISGKVNGRARQARVDRFQSAPKRFDVMLLSPRAGGVGLTLTRANHVIHLARWWNPAVEDQCNGRVLRIGQQRPVTIYFPLAVLPDGRPSFDDNLHCLLARKRKLMHDALLPPEAGTDELVAMLQDSLS